MRLHTTEKINATLDRRKKQVQRFIRATRHLDLESSIFILISWMDIERVDEMLRTVDKESEE